MSFGDIFGAVGDLSGTPELAILGYGTDAIADYQRLQGDKKFREAVFDLQKKEIALNQGNFLRQVEEQNALRDRLLVQSDSLAQVIKEVNSYLGVPYAPSQAEIANDMANLSASYRDDIFRLAELNKSTKEAAMIDRLGGGDSTTMQNQIDREVVEKYAPELRKADLQAKLDAIDFATKKLGFGKQVRDDLVEYYGAPYSEQFKLEQQLYNNSRISAPTGSYDAIGTSVDNALSKGQDSYAMSLKTFSEAVRERFGKKSEDEDDATFKNKNLTDTSGSS